MQEHSGDFPSPPAHGPRRYSTHRRSSHVIVVYNSRSVIRVTDVAIARPSSAQRPEGTCFPRHLFLHTDLEITS